MRGENESLQNELRRLKNNVVYAIGSLRDYIERNKTPLQQFTYDADIAYLRDKLRYHLRELKDCAARHATYKKRKKPLSPVTLSLDDVGDNFSFDAYMKKDIALHATKLSMQRMIVSFPAHTDTLTEAIDKICAIKTERMREIDTERERILRAKLDGA